MIRPPTRFASSDMKVRKESKVVHSPVACANGLPDSSVVIRPHSSRRSAASIAALVRILARLYTLVAAHSPWASEAASIAWWASSPFPYGT